MLCVNPQDSLYCSMELFKPFRPLLIPFPFKPAYNLPGHTVKEKDTREEGDIYIYERERDKEAERQEGFR